MIHVLEADSIQVRFGERVILSDIYLKCESGKITGLLGRNGQGKSCLMKIIYGIMNQEKSIRIDGLHLNEAYKRPDLLRYLPQFNFVPKSFSVKKVFQHYDQCFSSFVERFPEFEPKYKSSIGSLSGGGQRTIELYIILKSKTRFAMLDEPFTHLSPIQIEKVKALMLEEKENKGLIITDHMYQQVLEISDHIYILSNGKTHLAKNLSDLESLGYTRL